jgi:hypothetical protein
MTGLCQRVRGSSLSKDPLIEDRMSSGFQNVGFLFSMVGSPSECVTGEDHEMFKKWPKDKGGEERKSPHNDDDTCE